MKVKLERSFPLDATPERCWAVLENIDEVAACMPGAAITEHIDERHYKGEVRVKLGPARVAFKGDIEITALDAAERSLRLIGKGGDGKGTSASMDLGARIVPTEDGNCELVGESVVELNGKLVSIGSRMVNQVSEQILKQFGENFGAKVATPSTAEPAADTATEAAAGGPAAPTAAEAPSLNAFALLWSVVKSWFRGLLGKGHS